MEQGNTKFQLAMLDFASKKGVRPDQLTNKEITSISLKTMSLGEKIRCGADALSSVVTTDVLGIRVPVFVRNGRETACNSGRCGYNSKSASGELVCGVCGCNGEFMESALNNPNEQCRHPDPAKKLWGQYVNLTMTGLRNEH